MIRPISWLVGLVVISLGAGCNSYINVAFKPENLPAVPAAGAVRPTGRALLVMNAEDSAWRFRGSPPGRFEYYIKTEFAVGEITRQAALQVLGAAFKDGAEHAHTATGTGFTVMVTPKVDKFAYGWETHMRSGDVVLGLISLGAHRPPVKPWLNMEMHVVFRSPDGR